MNDVARLFDLIESRFKGNQAAFARAIGRQPAQINQYLKGRRQLGIEAKMHIEQSLGLQNWFSGTPSHVLDGLNFVGLQMADMPMHMVPLISSVRAGKWGEIKESQPNDGDEMAHVRQNKVGPNAFALRVEGDSMTSDVGLTFPEGTLLIVDPDRAPEAGKYVVAKDVDTQKATFKKLTTDGSRWYLKPLNRDYKLIEIDDPSMRVIGVVVEYWLGGKL
jgi:SOS-response transcriptional repressor LexA